MYVHHHFCTNSLNRFYLSLQEFIWPVVIMLAPLLFSVLAVFSKLKQVPWLRGLLIILLFESYGVATLVLVGSVHNKRKFCNSIITY